MEVGVSGDGWKSCEMRLVWLWGHHDVPDVICYISRGLQGSLRPESLKIHSSVSSVYYRVARSGGFPLHAALVERKGVSVLLAA